MFVLHRPSAREIDEFLTSSLELPLSYEPIGLARRPSARYRVDRHQVVVGQGRAAFERARAALASWRHFDLGWVELHPRDAPVRPGTVVAVVVRHLGFWSMNGARIVYMVESEHEFGFAYGTLTNHAERGEEIFAASLRPATGEVTYRLQAASRPRDPLARLGYPITRAIQARFRRDSAAAVARAVGT